METRVVSCLAEGSVAACATELLGQVQAEMGETLPALALVFASTEQSLSDLLPLMSTGLPSTVVLGASTAGEFTEREGKKRGVAMVAVSGDYRVFAGLGRGLRANPEACVRQALEGLPRAIQGYSFCTAILLLDPLAGNGEEATLICAEVLGESVKLAGGAAGDDLHMKETFVGCGADVASDALVLGLVFSKQSLAVGVQHGHTPISEPLRVTRAEGNVVHELDGRPAWEAWLAHAAEPARGQGFDPARLAAGEDVNRFLLRYEAGLAAGGSYKIRAPLTLHPDGSIGFACGIAQGAAIRITESFPERQIESARGAARSARKQLAGKRVAGALVFDCICRSLILSDQFHAAVKGISEELGGAPLAGFETYGEIALDVGDMSGFHNTTTVVLAFPA